MSTYEISTVSGSVIGTVLAGSEYHALRAAEKLYYMPFCTMLVRRI